MLFSGLRQCLAVFISELSKPDPTAGHDAHAGNPGGYCVSVPAVKKLKVLADNGNIER